MADFRSVQQKTLKTSSARQIIAFLRKSLSLNLTATSKFWPETRR